MPLWRMCSWLSLRTSLLMRDMFNARNVDRHRGLDGELAVGVFASGVEPESDNEQDP